MSEAPVLSRIVGNFDRMVGDRTVCGWAVDKADPGNRDIEVVVKRDGRPIGSAFARAKRDDGYHGYSVACSEEVTPWDILAQRIEVVARGAAGAETRLNLFPPLKERFAQAAFDRLIAPVATEGVAQGVRASLNELFGPGPSDVRPQQQITVRGPNDFSHFGVPVGVLSSDNSAVVGRGGQLYLHQGSNRLLDQYRADPGDAGLQSKADGWAALVRARREDVRKRGMAFLQVIVAEKSSVIPELFPFDIRPVTPLLRALEQRLRAVPELDAAYVSGARVLAEDPHRLETFPRTDSHFSPYGCFAVFKAVLAAFEKQKPGSVPRSLTHALAAGSCFGGKSRLMTGDLTRRFFGVPLYEMEQLPVAKFLVDAYEPTLETVREQYPPKGYNGARFEWRNPEAPIKRRVLACGSSSFGHGAGPQTLSWWFKHTCAEFHFAWDNAYLPELVEKVQPDLVICQTTERFIDKLPKA